MEQLLKSGIVVFILLAVSGGFAQATPKTIILSICDVRSQPKKYLGRVVTVTGDVQKTFHGISMSSLKCPDVGAALAESNGMRNSNPSLSELFRQGTWKTLTCENDGVFVVTVRGRFGTVVSRNLRMYRIVIDEVLRAEFTQQTSQYCIAIETLNPEPPPVVKIPLQPMPDLFH